MALVGEHGQLVHSHSFDTHRKTGERKRKKTQKELHELELGERLRACNDLTKGKLIHREITDRGLEKKKFLSNMLVSMYSRCGDIHLARETFDSNTKRNIFSWNIIISAYAQSGQHNQAISMYWRMHLEGQTPDKYSLSMVLDACSTLGAVSHGRSIHDISKQLTGVDDDPVVVNSLIDFYGRTGLLHDARLIFDRGLSTGLCDAVSWTSLLGSYAQQGHCEISLELFYEMQVAGVSPDRVTFLNVLYACSQGGFFEQGMEIFTSASRDYGIRRDRKQDSCVIDLLGRAGMLRQAEQVIQTMEAPDVVCWTSLLNACKIHGDVDLGTRAARRILSWDPNSDFAFVMLSNVLAAKGKWKEVAELRRQMERQGVRKTPGVSWIEVRRKVHRFYSGDESHSRTGEIHEELERLKVASERLGYVPSVEGVLMPDVMSESEKERRLWRHSERLAIGFGVVSSSPGSCLRIIKNIRVCEDCHNAIKYISKVTGREILVRDTSRFHRFSEAGCSCKDYW